MLSTADTNVKEKKLSKDDKKTMLKIIAENYRDCQRPVVEEFEKTLDMNDISAEIFRENGEIVGFFIIQQKEAELWIRFLNVRKSTQGTGVAHRMMNEINRLGETHTLRGAVPVEFSIGEFYMKQSGAVIIDSSEQFDLPVLILELSPQAIRTGKTAVIRRYENTKKLAEDLRDMVSQGYVGTHYTHNSNKKIIIFEKKTK